MTEQQERAAFEKWALSEEGGWWDDALTRSGDGYKAGAVTKHWIGWLARAALAAEPAAAPATGAPDFWPIARLTVDASGSVTAATLYAPGLPPGTHDVYPASTAHEYERGRAAALASIQTKPQP